MKLSSKAFFFFKEMHYAAYDIYTIYKLCVINYGSLP